jgi:hypothetical protein
MVGGVGTETWLYIYLYFVHSSSSSFRLVTFISTLLFARPDFSYIVRIVRHSLFPLWHQAEYILLPGKLVGGKTDLKSRFEAFGGDDEFLTSTLLLATSKSSMRSVASHTGEKGA